MTIQDLDKFTRAYIECALWSSMDNANDQGGEPLEANYDLEDISAECLKSIIEDCQQFQADNAEDLAQAGNDDQNGHDFWLTRCGHGAGFWDRGYGKLGAKLTAACKVCGNVDLYIGDDGKIYSN